MNTAGVSAVQPSPELRQFFQNRVSDLRQLRQSLEAGDLDGAKQAFRALVNLGKQGPFPGSDTFLGTRREQDFQAVGHALQSGDLKGAQQAFVSLFETFHRRPAQPAVPEQSDASPSNGVDVVA